MCYCSVCTKIPRKFTENEDKVFDGTLECLLLPDHGVSLVHVPHRTLLAYKSVAESFLVSLPENMQVDGYHIAVL